MKVVTQLAEWKRLRLSITGTVGVVPTMGFLHEGHLSLVRRARRENQAVVVWIFVNPKQFGPKEDFGTYPRDMARDLALVEHEGADYVLAPPVEEVYPPGFQTRVEVERLTQRLEGAARPGHFHGVTTVVAKLLCLTEPRRAYFGQKDAQQVLVVSRMVRDLGMLGEIVTCPTMREPDGLAMSSRNVRLSPPERKAAVCLYRALCAARDAHAAGQREGEALREAMRRVLAAEPLARPDYVSMADPETLEELATLQGPALASLAVRIGATRLIDNMPLPAPEG
ncbi:MAG: pantoate--beta-alanine ligase [Candidatus Lambdaproteobacteria bacterium]|nr:pantoate--beta-alanine ligase [Candidatus Lambdaproteobacteria bacterium]